MEVRHARSPALWELDPVAIDNAADIADHHSSERISLLKQLVYRPVETKPHSKFGEVLAEIW